MALFDAEGGVDCIPAHGMRRRRWTSRGRGHGHRQLRPGARGGASFGDAARLANVAGALVVQKPGTATVTRDELSAELRSAR